MAGRQGRVVVLSGEADLTCLARLNQLISSQLSAGTLHLTLDVSGLRFADAASVRVLALAARTLGLRGGSLTLVRPRPAVARILDLTGLTPVLTIRPDPAVTATAGPDAIT